MEENSELSSIDIRSLKCIEGIQFSYNMIENIMTKLHDTCIQIENDESKVYEALQLCWSFIDSVYRIREILQSLPRLNKKDRKLRIFLSETKITKDYRHYIQHLRSELTKTDYDKFPVWGSLSWVDKNIDKKCHCIIFGSKIPGISYSGCGFDQVEKKWVSNVCLSIKNYSYNFDIMYEELKDYMNHFIQWIDDNHQNIKNNYFDLIINTIEINISDEK